MFLYFVVLSYAFVMAKDTFKIIDEELEKKLKIQQQQEKNVKEKLTQKPSDDEGG